MTKIEIINAIDIAINEILTAAANKGISADHPQIVIYQNASNELKTTTENLTEERIKIMERGTFGKPTAAFSDPNPLKRLSNYRAALKGRGYIQ